MNKIQTFEQFLMTTSAQFSIVNYTMNLCLTALLAFALSVLYSRYGRSLSNRNSFGANFVILAVTTMIIITIVKSSLALSLGLVGALSIVRFRAAIKEPEELTYLFLNIAIGLGFGADQKLATIVGFVFVAFFLIVTRGGKLKNTCDNFNIILILNVENPSKNQLNQMTEILTKNCTKVNLKRFDETDKILEASFITEFKSFSDLNDSKIELQEKFDNLSVSFIDNNINI